MIFGIAATENIDDPTTGILACCIVRFNKPITPRRVTTVSIV
jgi:hypothetical protein